MIIKAESQAAEVVVPSRAAAIAVGDAGPSAESSAATARAQSDAILVVVRTICARGPVRSPATFKIAAKTRANAAAVRCQPARPEALPRYSAKTSAIAAIDAG